MYFYIFSNLETFLQQTFQYCLSLIDFERKDPFKYLLSDSFFSLFSTRIQNVHFSFELFIILGFRHSRRLHVEGGCVERLQEVCDPRRRRMCILFARNRKHIHQLVHIHQQLVHIHQQLVHIHQQLVHIHQQLVHIHQQLVHIHQQLVHIHQQLVHIHQQLVPATSRKWQTV